MIGKRYKKLKRLGSGTYGTIFKARDQERKTNVVVKQCKPEDEGLPDDILREVSCLNRLNHDNIIKSHDFIVSSSGTCNLVLERMFGDLEQETPHRGLPLPTAKSYLKQILSAVEHCHSNLVIHQDLKPENLLLTEDRSTVKLIDFGLSTTRFLEKKHEYEPTVSLFWRAPEIILRIGRHGPEVDMWSIGTLFYEMVTGSVLFEGDDEEEVLELIFKLLGTPTDESWPEFRSLPEYSDDFPKFSPKPISKWASKLDPLGQDLLSNLLTINPEKRITARQALAHPWFAPDGHSTKPVGSMSLATDAFQNILRVESRTVTRKNPTADQKEITANMRSTLIEALTEITVSGEHRFEALCLAKYIIDTFLLKNRVDSGSLLLLGITAFVIATKTEDMEPMALKSARKIANKKFSEKKIKDMEVNVVSALKSQLWSPTPLHFLDLLFAIQHADNKTRRIATFLAIATLPKTELIEFNPSRVACACLFIANNFTSSQAWPESLQSSTLLSSEDVSPCAETIMTCIKAGVPKSVCEAFSCLELISPLRNKPLVQATKPVQAASAVYPVEFASVASLRYELSQLE